MKDSTTVAPYAHPVDLIIAITGSEQVTLKGFGAEPMPHSWVRPGVRFVGVEETPAGALAAVLARQKKLQLLHLAIAAALIVCGLGLGYLFRVATAGPGSAAAQSSATQYMQWTPRSVTSEGLSIDTFTIVRGKSGLIQEPVTKLIRIGSVLPNGETLTATVPDMQAFTSGNTTSMITGTANGGRVATGAPAGAGTASVVTAAAADTALVPMIQSPTPAQPLGRAIATSPQTPLAANR